MEQNVPDTITSWIISAFSISEDNGFGLTKSTRKLEVFQPFFVSLNLPYSVKRGEILSVPVIVFNYLENDVDAEVVLHNHDNEFDFIDSNNSIVDENILKKMISITSNNGGSVSFMIRPKKIGFISIKASVNSLYAGDTIMHVLNVKSEGIRKFGNKALVSKHCIFIDKIHNNFLLPTQSCCSVCKKKKTELKK